MSRWVNYKGRKCNRCNSDKTSSNWCKEKDKKGNWTGKFLCNKCWMRDYNKTPYSNNGVRRIISDYRNKRIGIYSKFGKGIIGECVVAKVLNIRSCEDCNLLKNYDYHQQYDMVHKCTFEHKNYGKIDVKTSSLHRSLREYAIYDIWKFNTERNNYCDHYFCIGFDEYWTNIEVIYIIPNRGWILDICAINIIKDSHSKYNEFKVDKEPYNMAYHNLKIENCPVLESH